MLGNSAAALACPLPVEQDWRIRVSPRRSGSSSSSGDKAAVARLWIWSRSNDKDPRVEGQSRRLVPGCTGSKEHPGTPSEVAEGHWGNDW